MTSKLLLAAALAFGLGTATAMAQNDQLEPDSGAAPGTEATTPPGARSLGESFFVDPATRTLRTEAEVRAGWSQLSAQQRAEVRDYCGAVDAAAAPPDDEMTTGSVTPDSTMPDSAMDVASIERSCSWVSGM